MSVVLTTSTRSLDFRYFGSLDYNVYAVNATTGEGLWSFPTGLYVSCVPAVKDGIVYVHARPKAHPHLRVLTVSALLHDATGTSEVTTPAFMLFALLRLWLEFVNKTFSRSVRFIIGAMRPRCSPLIAPFPACSVPFTWPWSTDTRD